MIHTDSDFFQDQKLFHAHKNKNRKQSKEKL